MLRFAPSPTGDMHIGNLRVALFNHILSKQLNEKLIIRIEDTDDKRNIEGKDKEILELLNLFSIDYESVVYQSDHFKNHQKMAMKLLVDKKAFSCFCSDEFLSKQREEAKLKKKPFRYDGHCENLSDELVLNTQAPFSVRIKKPQHTIVFKDKVKGSFEYQPFDVDSFVILRQDKKPTYNYACAVDDMLYNISTVIRGEDHLSNTPKQIHIRESLGYSTVINYIHLPIILNEKTGKKMSKRDSESSVKWLVEEGILPVAIANYLILLGNSVPCEIFTVEEALAWFDIKKVSKSSARFDMKKLLFINKEHLKRLDELRLSKILGFADESIGKLAKLYLEESHTIKELQYKVDLIFSQKDDMEGFEESFSLLKETVKQAPFFDDFQDLKTYISSQTGLKGKFLFKPLRYLLTGCDDGPNLSDIYPFIKHYLGEIVR